MGAIIYIPSAKTNILQFEEIMVEKNFACQEVSIQTVARDHHEFGNLYFESRSVRLAFH
jgi:hypothetical protein